MLPGKWYEWEITDELGSGSYGTVYQIKKGDAVKAVKIIEIPQEYEYPLIMKEHGQNAEAYCRSIAQDFETEIQTLILLGDCENIIHIDDFVIKKKEHDIGWTIYIFMDCYSSLVEYASLHELSEKDVINMALEITNALVTCEKEGIIHRDIKPENILVTNDGHFLLCDFGLARKLNYKQMASSVKGTYKYMAPEVYHGEPYTHSVDIYSLGLILYQWMNKRRGMFIPLDKDTIYYKDQEKALESRMGNMEIPPPCDASEGFADIILRMVAYDPKERYSNAEFLYRDLLLLKEGKYRKRYGLIHYRKHIAAFLAAIALVAGFMIWHQWPVFKDKICGKNAVCTLTNGGTLIISGQGDVEYADEWMDYDDDIKRVVVKEGIENLGSVDDSSGALFQGCKNLERVELPNGLKSLGTCIFSDCENLYSINIPKSLESCGTDAFTNTKWIADNADGDGFVIRNEIILDYIGKKEEVSVPEGISYLDSDTFANHDEIISIHFPESLTAIDYHAFINCDKLDKVTGGENIGFIGEYAFADTAFFKKATWPSLNGILLGYNGKEEEVSIPAEITKLGDRCLGDNLYIRKVTIPENVKEISGGAFYENKSVQDVDIKAPIEFIEPETFAGCTNLETVKLPASLKEIYGHAFYQCVNLKMKIPEGVKICDDDHHGNIVGDPFEGCDAMKDGSK